MSTSTSSAFSRQSLLAVSIPPALGLVAVLALFASTLRHLWWRTNPFWGEADWSHAVFVPLIAAVYLMVNRARLTALPQGGNWFGLLPLLLGLGAFVYAKLNLLTDFAQGLAMICIIFGLVLTIFGWPFTRVAGFAVGFLVCAIPWSDRVYSYIARPLQSLAASCAVVVLRVFDVDAIKSGTTILIFRAHEVVRPLNVAEACSGLRSLMTFVTIAIAVAFCCRRKFWQQAIIVVAAVPIAVACNVIRVAGVGLLDHFVSESVSDGFYHQFVGVLVLVPGSLLILSVAWSLESLGNMQESTAQELQPRFGLDGGRAIPRSRQFYVAIALVALAAIALWVAPPFVTIYLSKEALSLQRPLASIPAQLGNWQQVSTDAPLTRDLEQALGTQQYLVRVYANTRFLDEQTSAQLLTIPPSERDRAIHQVEMAAPQAIIRLAITFYSGDIESVPHLADNCYLANGMEPQETVDLQWHSAAGTIPCRLLRLRNVTGAGLQGRTVAYFFQVNGRLASSAEDVNHAIRDPRTRYAYFLKVEATNCLVDEDRAPAMLSDFFAALVPELLRVAPRWKSAAN